MVRNLIHKVVDHNTHVGNDAKALLIKGALMRIHTELVLCNVLLVSLIDYLCSDVFYIIVYDREDILRWTGLSKESSNRFSYSHDQGIWVKDRGLCHTFIYRSRQWKNVAAGSPAFEQFKGDVERCSVNIPLYVFRQTMNFNLQDVQ